ncbi:MAG: hypothetical protein U5R31_00915 [Acidimicrobiia bacterium]|nr:hypothetical protein [Acidimicrobiia bacterium]
MSIVFVALALVGLVTIAALVVDLGHERMLRREAQSMSDLVTLAAAQAMTHPDGADPVAGCEEAEQFTEINIENLPDTWGLDCSPFADIGGGTDANGLPMCDGTSSPEEVVSTGSDPYVVSVKWPVPNSDITDPDVQNTDGLRKFDGFDADDQCDRISVTISVQQASFFSAIVRPGEDLEAGATAVARRLPYSDVRTPNLWLLEPYGCGVLEVGGAQATDLQVGTTSASGLITIDSSGDGANCSNDNDFVMDVNGSNSDILAYPNGASGNPNGLDPPGEISMVALAAGQDGCVNSGYGNLNACDATLVPGQIDPNPTRRPLRATRAPVDWAYNCKESYPDYVGQNGDTISIAGCPYTDQRDPYIQRLKEWLYGSGFDGHYRVRRRSGRRAVHRGHQRGHPALGQRRRRLWQRAECEVGEGPWRSPAATSCSSTMSRSRATAS